MSTSSSMAPASSEVVTLKAKREKVEAKRDKVEDLLEMDDDNLPEAYRMSPYKQWKDFTRLQLNVEKQQLSDEIKRLSDEIKRLDEKELAYIRAAAPGKHPSESLR